MIAIYARQSVDKKDSISIESQIEKCKKEFDNEEYVEYIDKGYSGKNIERPYFTEMIQDIKNGLITKVIVYKIDRISRAIVDFGKIMEMFNKFNVEFVSHTEKFDTSTPIGRAMLNIIMVFAQLERETIQQRVKDNYYDRGQQGFYLGGKAPFGYEKIKTQHKGKKTYTFTEKQEQSKIVLELFKQYAYTDISLGRLAEELNKKSIKTNFGNNWSSVSISRILRNPVYVQADADVYTYLKNKGANMNNNVNEYNAYNGCYVYAERHSISKSKFADLKHSYVTLALHKGIIASTLWLKCQYKLDNNRQIKNSGKGKHTWISGIIKCGYCGFAINVVNSNNNKYINCGGRKLKLCHNRKRIIYIEDIEFIVENRLFYYIKNLKNENFKDVKENNSEINQFKIKLIEIQEKIDTLITKLSLSNDVTINYINEAIKQLDDTKKEITSEIFILSNTKSKSNCKNINIKSSINDWQNYNLEEKKSIAKIFIKKISVTDDNIEILFY